MLAVLSCEKPREPIAPTDLDYQRPFGLRWDSYDGDGHRHGKDPWEGCVNKVNTLSKFIDPDDKKDLVELCAQEKYTTISLPNHLLPPAFRGGELSLAYRGKSEPVAYDYSYLHRVRLEPSSSFQARRREHALEIRKQLTSLYGAPDTYGTFEQFSRTGFIASGDEDGPCQFWVKEEVGILLCSERVILIDGIEMALSFTRLDRAPFGRALECMIEKGSKRDCSAATGPDAANSVNGANGFLDILVDWVGPETFRNCQLEDLEPLEQRLFLPKVEEERLFPILKTHAADELARYAIDDYSEGDDRGMTPDMREKILLFLLGKAASQGSVIAMNEIGASQLYCYLHVEQDTHGAQIWLEKAAASGDVLAQKSLALMYLSGMIETENPRDDAARILEQCAVLDQETCSKELEALNKVSSLSE